MPIFYLFRVFVQDQSDCDNDEDEWVSFDSVSVAADVGLRDLDTFQDKDQESVVRRELQKIAEHKIFRAVVHKSTDVHTLRALFLLQQQDLIVATDIELYKYDDLQGKDTATLFASMAFNSKITGHSIDSVRNYGFRFEIVGSIGVDNAPDMSGSPWMAEKKDTRVGWSQRLAAEGLRLVVAFAGTEDSPTRYKAISKRSESLGSFSARPWQRASSVRRRFWVEAGLAALSGFLAILTLFTDDWIEALTGFDPDDHNGAFEWAIVAALVLVCLLLSTAARTDWRRLTASKLAEI